MNGIIDKSGSPNQIVKSKLLIIVVEYSVKLQVQDDS